MALMLEIRTIDGTPTAGLLRVGSESDSVSITKDDLKEAASQVEWDGDWTIDEVRHLFLVDTTAKVDLDFTAIQRQVVAYKMTKVPLNDPEKKARAQLSKSRQRDFGAEVA